MIRWTPPDPRKLPDWRASMIEHLGTIGAKRVMKVAIDAGKSTLLPMVPGMDASVGAIATEILHRSEIERLRQARLYYATPDMTALAVAAAKTTPIEPVSMDRPPSPYGFMTFGEPIGGYDQDAGTVLAGTAAYAPGVTARITTPIVAVSWSPWSPHAVTLDGGNRGQRVRWIYNGGGRSRLMRDDFTGLWVTFYSPRGSFAALDPSTLIGRHADGSPMRAGQIEHTRRTRGPVLAWDNEMAMREGGKFEEPKPDTNGQWAAVVYTAWQLMGQKGADWTQQETLTRSKTGIKRDAHGGILGGSDVCVVDVHKKHRPTRAQADQDAANSTGYRQGQHTCRYPVEPYRRNQCLNTHAHADGGCRHEDRIVPGHLRGPVDGPLRVRERVNLWASQPDQQGA